MQAFDQSKANLRRVPPKWWIAVTYVVLVLLSNAFPIFSAVEKQSSQNPILVPAFDYKDDRVIPTEKQIPIHANFYGFDQNNSAGDKPVLVYIHRVPWDSRGNQFCADLAQSGKVAVVEPYLPGFASSYGNVPSHSMEANAHVVAALLEQKGIKKYHLLGQGLGGVAALELTNVHRDRVESVTLLSAPGVQAFELLGNPLVNKIVYGFQGAFFWGVARLTPNFGAADLLACDRDYAKTVFDTDLSENKRLIDGLNRPLLIIHGDSDLLTPVDAAKYTAKLIPSARLKIYQGGRDVVFEQKEAVVGEIVDFTTNLPKLGPPLPASNPPIPQAIGMHYWMLLLFIIVCTFVAEDPTCLASGLMVSVGIIDFWSATMACFIGIFIGDMTLYMIGRVFGRQAIRRAPFKWIIKEHKVNQWAGWFSTPKGMLVVVSSRFVPASRLPTFITAGIMKLDLMRLGLLLMVAALIWTPPLIWLGYKFGDDGMRLLHNFKSNAVWIIVGLLVGLHVLTHWLVPALTWRGRRQIIMKVRGFLQPSLWPNWIVYLPIRIGIIFLTLRHRSLTAFASANPSFGRIGGFAGDAKSLLLRPFQRDSRCCPHIALSMEDKVDERLKEAQAFAVCHGYPLVFKPEVSEDGAGLRYIKNDEQLNRWVGHAKEDFILQKFISGLEFEIVWRRNPGQDDGHIMAIVQKNDIVVMGDGEQTLEELIWLDEFAVSRAELFIQCHARDLNKVIPAGQKVILNLSGSYGHGARCLHRPDLNTSALEQALTTLAKRFPALHYARFDVRISTEEELKSGRFTVIGVGGCCHVSSLVRDESLLFRRSYSQVWQQLKVCLEAGAYNLKQNVRPVRLDELMARWSQANGRSDNFVVSEE
jgi:membrane protein DedA with SNARE-associated domain/pimeloyl-ACP methyl ester carboxylesterase